MYLSAKILGKYYHRTYTFKGAICQLLDIMKSQAFEVEQQKEQH